MTIVDRLKHLSEVGMVIPCPEMTLLAADDEPPIVIGAGDIKVLTETSFGYTLRGTPVDVGRALRSLRRIDEDVFDGRLRARLTVTTAGSETLMGGWTIPKVHLPDKGGPWVFTGEIESLSFSENSARALGTEVAYLLPLHHRARVIFRRFFPQPADGSAPEMHLKVLGSEVTFTLDDEADMLRVWVPATHALRPPFTENWIGEPLRILFGQPIYPRFVSRNSEIGSTSWVRPSPSWSRESDACALWQGEKEFIDREAFWETYRRLLAYVALGRDGDGHPNFEAHKLTKLYDEVVQAAHGSRWVWALVYASAVEAMLKLLGYRGQPRADLDAAALAQLAEGIDGFISYVDRWEGDPRPKEPAKRAASRMLKMSSVETLRQLKRNGWIKAHEFDAWDRLRNRVMHGSLVSPYSSEEDDKILLHLAYLFHTLTRRLLKDVDPDAVVPADQSINSPGSTHCQTTITP